MGDKKARGQAGAANAEANPFRLNGWAPDWQLRLMRAYTIGKAASSGSTTMRGLVGGILATKLGHPFPTLHNIDRMIEHAQKRCTHPLFRDDDEPQRKAA